MHTLPEIRHAYEAIVGHKIPDDFDSKKLILACLDLTALDAATAEGEFILRLQLEAHLTGTITYAYNPAISRGTYLHEENHGG